MWSLHNFTVGLLMWINTNFVDFWRVSLLQNIGIHLQVRSSLWIQIPACQPLGEMPHTRYSESQDSENDGTHRFRHLMFSGIRFCSLRSLQKTSVGSWDFYEPKNVQNLSTKTRHPRKHSGPPLEHERRNYRWVVTREYGWIAKYIYHIFTYKIWASQPTNIRPILFSHW